MQSGVLEFGHERLAVKEDDKFVHLKVVRTDGFDGKVGCRVYTRDVTAKAYQDYEPCDVIIELEDGQRSAVCRSPHAE